MEIARLVKQFAVVFSMAAIPAEVVVADVVVVP